MLQGIVMQAAYFGLRPMVTYRAMDLDASAGQIGLLAAAFGGLSLLVAIPVGRWLDRIGPGRGTVVGVSVEALGAGMALLANNFNHLFIAATVIGLGHVIAMPGHTMYIATHFPSGKHMEMYTNYSTMVSVGQAIGPAATLYIAGQFAASSGVNQVNSQAGLIIALLFCLSALPAAIAIREAKGQHALKHPQRTAEERRIEKKLRKESGIKQTTWAVMLSSTIVVASQDVLITFLPLWAVARDISPSTVGALLASRAIFTLLIRLISVRLVQGYGRKAILSWSIFCGCIGFASLTLVGQSLAFVSMAFLGIGLGIAQPITLVMLMDTVDQSNRGKALGVRMFGHRLGQLGLPLAMGGVADIAGMNGAWLATTLVMSSGIFLTIFKSPPEQKPKN
jgi:MFS family permease